MYIFICDTSRPFQKRVYRKSETEHNTARLCQHCDQKKRICHEQISSILALSPDYKSNNVIDVLLKGFYL